MRESAVVFVVILASWALACGYSELEMQVERDRGDMLERALTIAEQSGRDYLDKLEATLRRCPPPPSDADAGVQP